MTAELRWSWSLRHAVASAWNGVEAADLSPDRRQRLLTRQIHFAAQCSAIANLANIVSILIVSYAVIPAELGDFRNVWMLVAVTVILDSGRRIPRCRRPSFVATRRDVVRLYAEVIVQSLLSGIMLLRVTPHLDDGKRVILIATYVGVLGCGAIVLSTFRRLGLLWTWCSALFLGLTFARNMGPNAPIAVAQIVLYGAVVSIGTVYLSRSFAARCISEMEAEDGRETVRMLLDEFEDGVREWLWEADGDDHLVRVSPSFAACAQRSAVLIQGSTLTTLLVELDVDRTVEGHTALRRLNDCVATKSAFRDLVVPVQVAGESRWWSISGRPLSIDSGVGWRGVGADVTHEYLAQQEIVRLANADVLTGLANRHRFNVSLAAILEATHEPVVVGIIDLDNFKLVNDTLGHPLGDEVLVQVARRLRSAIRSPDVCARIGGDEFAIILTNCSGLSDVGQRFSDILQVFIDPITCGGTNLHIRASAGYVTSGSEMSAGRDLLMAADLALFAAKAAGGQCALPFVPTLAVAAHRRATMIRELNGALERDEFEVWFQPQVDLRSRRVVAMEALLRWRHPELGLVLPNTFIGLAEESGLIVPIGQRVLEKACAAATRWPDDIMVAVNVSGVQLASDDFVGTITRALAASGLPPKSLEIEVTESTTASAAALTTLTELKSFGVAVSIDDFGTGYSSFGAIRELSPSQLKIDRSFVAPLADAADAASTAILAALVGVAHALGITTVAEGAETDSVRGMLANLGVDRTQGFIDGHPMPASEVAAFLVGFDVVVDH